MTTRSVTTIAFRRSPRDVAVRILSLASVKDKAPVAVTSSAPDADTSKQNATAPTDEVVVANLLKDLNEKLARQLGKQEASLATLAQEMSETTVELACMIGKQLVGKTIETESCDLSELVTEAISRLMPSEKITVNLNPEDRIKLDEQQTEFNDLNRLVKLVPDANLPRGSCRVVSDNHTLVSTLDSRFASIREMLIEGIDDAWDRKQAAS